MMEGLYSRGGYLGKGGKLRKCMGGSRGV